jgi:large subunit ribosomal protein L31
MRTGIHPGHNFTAVRCTCGNQFQILSKHASLTVDICSACHPFYTGTQKFVDTAGRVDAFTKRFAWNADEAKKQAAKLAEKQAQAAPERKPQMDLKLELEKRKVFGKKKPVPVPGEKGEDRQ